ncbi:tumor necrosis factor receptor superfamily member 14 isoform X2 [Phalacrocorax aristotelis]|uniref:tumor necrosis factor receptor superfamily member 14 isoform X2 n=1 Tax=Phalacrocorax aristotelis TaxID=126867 RepID=UPI003F4B1A6B
MAAPALRPSDSVRGLRQAAPPRDGRAPPYARRMGPRAAGGLLRGRRAPRLRDPARRTMCLVFAAVLVTQLDGVGALDCGPGEYPVGTECCPMCAAGLRVFKHCTANSSTTCVPCAEDTYTDKPNGSERCRKCKRCDKGANLVPEVACTYTKNTVCGCLPGYFCRYFGAEDCELCQRYTVCFPGTMVKERGTKTTDNVCEACPPGTSSTANMSYSCTPRPSFKENTLVKGEDRNPSSASSVTAVAGFAVGAVLVVAAGLAYIWQRRKRKDHVRGKYERPSGQQALILTMDDGDQTAVPVQETHADPQAARPE